MTRLTFRRFLALALLALSTAANAFVDAPTISPSTPIAGQQIFVNIRAGDCDGFHFAEPGLPSVTRDGNHVRLLVAAFHTDYDPFCNAPPYELSTSIGSLPAGTYTIQVDRTYELVGTIVETLAILEISVAPPAVVPTLSTSSIGWLVLLLLSAALIAQRRPTTLYPCFLFCVSALTWSSSSHAFVDPPVFSPVHPLAGQPVTVNIRSGECDGFYEGAPGYPKIERNGQSIRLLLRGVHETDQILCNGTPSVLSTAIGAYAAGHYVLQVDRFYEGLQLPTTETLGILNMDVTEPASVPAGGIDSAWILVFLVVAGAAWYRSKMRREPFSLALDGLAPLRSDSDAMHAASCKEM